MADYLTPSGMVLWVDDVAAVAEEVVEAAEAFRRALGAGESAEVVQARKDAVRAAEAEMGRVLTARLAVVSEAEAALRGH